MNLEHTCTFDEWTIKLTHSKNPSKLSKGQKKIVEAIREAVDTAFKRPMMEGI